MRRLINSMAMLWLVFQIQPLHSQALQFAAEAINIRVEEDTCRLSGDYWFVNHGEASLISHLIYPFVLSDKMAFPHFISVAEVETGRPIDYAILKYGIRFPLKILPSDTVSYRVEYHQKVANKIFEYILTSTRTWHEPLKKAKFRIEIPENYRLNFVSIPYQRVMKKGERLIYVIEKNDLSPGQNLVMQWETER